MGCPESVGERLVAEAVTDLADPPDKLPAGEEDHVAGRKLGHLRVLVAGRTPELGRAGRVHLAQHRSFVGSQSGFACRRGEGDLLVEGVAPVKASIGVPE